MMINTDYKIDALDILLNEDCLNERYYPLIEYKKSMVEGLKNLGCATKNDISGISDEALAGAVGMNDLATVGLFRKFLSIYDPKPQKFKEIMKLTSDPAEQAAFEELYHLPGVKYTRAFLYFQSGYRTIESFANTTAEEVFIKTAKTISEKKLACIVPLPKEVRTHIAVAKAFCYRES